MDEKTPAPKRRPTKTIVHVNQHIIRSNLKTGANDPVLTVKQGKTNTCAHEVDILGPSKVVHSPTKPLSWELAAGWRPTPRW